MKNKEMQEICDKHKNNCRECPLNLPDNLWKDKISWCLIDVRQQAINKYQDALNKNNEVLASKIMKDYQDLERKLNL